MRLTWYSNAPWLRTGYGSQTAQVTRRMKAAGHEVAVAANAGLWGTQTEWEGIRVLPEGRNRYSTDIVGGHHRLWAPKGWLFTLYDVWGLEEAGRADKSIFDGLRIASWLPIDHQPCPPQVATWAQQHIVIAMSQFGQRMLDAIGVDSTYIPHGIERTFRPTPLTTAGEPFRQAAGIPDDAFLVTINSANTGNHPPRKGWGEMFLAASQLMRQHGDVFLYVHADQLGYQGVNLPVLAAACDIPQDRLIFADRYAILNGLIGDEDMAAIYTGSDVLLATSYGEGFGLPVVEAQACGTPVIVSDFSAQPELVGAGWKVPVQPMWDEPHSSFFGMPIQAFIVEALERAYDLRDDPEVAEQAIAKAAEYDADRVFEERWKPLLAEMEPLPEGERVPGTYYDRAYFTRGTKSNYRPYAPGFWSTALAGMIAEYLRPASVLDVGCAYGFIPKSLAERGVDAYGFDISSWAVEQADDDRIWQGDATDPTAYRPVDLIVSTELGEHLTEDQARTFLRLSLANADRLLLLVGAIREGENTYEHHFDDDLSHINIQPMSWWIREAQEAGWELADADAFNSDERSRVMKWNGRFLYLRRPSSDAQPGLPAA